MWLYLSLDIRVQKLYLCFEGPVKSMVIAHFVTEGILVLHSNAEAWTEDEAFTIYREKLVRLRSLYTAQLARLKHSLAERRREYLLEWMAAGGDKEEGK